MTKSCWHLPERFPKWLYSLALLFYGLLVHALRLQAGVVIYARGIRIDQKVGEIESRIRPGIFPFERRLMFAFRELVLVADLLATVMECNRQLGLLDELPSR